MSIKKMGFYKALFAVAASALISFYAGVRYEQIDRHRQEILMFANILGDELVDTNRLIDSFEKKGKEETVKDYNQSMLDDIGCSAWLEYLDYFDQKDLSSFNAGVDLALEKIGAVDSGDNECVSRILSRR